MLRATLLLCLGLAWLDAASAERWLDTECGVGQYLNATTCASCPAGTWKNEVGDSEDLCLDCPSHDSESSDDRTTCVCTSGAFAEVDTDVFDCVDASLYVATQPGSAIEDELLGQQPVVRVVDATLTNVNTVGGAEMTAVVFEGGEDSGLGSFTVEVVAGVATFADVMVPVGGSGFTLEFQLENANDLAATSNEFEVWFADAVDDTCSGLIDAGGECCASGVIDACGVCDGDGDSCKLLATIPLTLSTTLVDEFDADVAAQTAWLEAFCDDVETALGLTAGRCTDPKFVPEAAVLVAARLLAAADYASVQVTISPPDTIADLSQQSVEDDLLEQAQNPASVLLTGASAQYINSAKAPQVSRSGVCPNNECETGETSDTCPNDCHVANVDSTSTDDDDDDDLTIILIVVPIVGVIVLYCVAMKFCIKKKSSGRSRLDAQGVLMRLQNPRFAPSTHGQPGQFHEGVGETKI